MPDPIEAMARAMCREDLRPGYDFDAAWEAEGPAWIASATAALRALRDNITGEMAEAMRQAWRETRTPGVCGMTIDAQQRAERAREYAMARAMIDAATGDAG